MAYPILIADTEESTREALKHIIADHTPLIIVESQAHGLDILSKNQIRLVFMGLHDEGGINTDVFSDIQEKFPKLTVIAIGDYKSEDHATEAVRQGATGYMIKPFKAEEVMAVIQKNMNEQTCLPIETA